MTARWTPKWEIKRVEINGRKYDICYDLQTGLYSCPICRPCDSRFDERTKGTYFFTQDDTIYHLANHDRTQIREIERTDEEEEEESQDVEEEEED
ncbi:hypothetical protein HS1genome_0837 [Sulfodiicoccus acidiphilus]|uniref:Uncharacterized protein n=1 Tax=Sulfodiicoccus acidiphilus TaxID=1670455 RepID=A0A348B2P6_9CREN|nr:hypothetical protein HS1genome_0837 [Sulfodiicoccus acidiphilus]GGT97070.1 hypothetical protein GCM10007116_13210 [Sulfodiicoccus acidiphilus]